MTWEPTFVDELEKLAKKDRSGLRGLGIGLTAGAVSSLLTHPIEHVLYGNPYKPLKIGKKVLKWRGKKIIVGPFKEKFFGHLALRLPKAAIAGLGGFGAYHLLTRDKR